MCVGRLAVAEVVDGGGEVAAQLPYGKAHQTRGIAHAAMVYRLLAMEAAVYSSNGSNSGEHQQGRWPEDGWPSSGRGQLWPRLALALVGYS